MANKFGKFLLFTGAVATGAAAALYYLKKKDADNAALFDDDEDYDDFSESYDEDLDASRNYVTLNQNAQEANAEAEGDGFVPLAEAVEAHVEDVVEEFFDEDDVEEVVEEFME